MNTNEKNTNCYMNLKNNHVHSSLSNDNNRLIMNRSLFATSLKNWFVTGSAFMFLILFSGLDVLAQNVSLTYTGVTSWTVPTGVTSVKVKVYGGGGGTGGDDGFGNSAAGPSGYVEATYAVSGGQVIGIYPGGKGGNGANSATNNGAGAAGAGSYPFINFNGGSGGNAGWSGSSGGGGGGGAATVVTLNSTIVAVAGGAGGGGGSSNCFGCFTPGYGTSISSGQYYGGNGSSGTSCGIADGGGGGGGGGGYFGSVGGGTYVANVECAGYGGYLGSNYVASASSTISNSSTAWTANGQVIIEYTAVAGTASANQTICSGSFAADLTLSGYNGDIQWQVSSNNVTFTNISGATGATLTAAQMGTLNATRYYRAMVSNTLYSNTITVTVNPIPLLSINNSLCTSNTLQWMNMTSVTSSSAAGIGQNGITVAVTQSGGGMLPNNGMYQPGDFPAQYNVPGLGTTVIQNNNAGNFQACFSQPVVNPTVAFSSVGNPSTPVTVTVSQPYTIVWSGTGTTWTSNTQFIGQEGDNIIRLNGTVTCVNFNYGTSETYCTIAFGFENQNCYSPTICSGSSVTLTASGSTNYAWTPSTGLSSATGASVIASPTTTTVYTVSDPSDVCAAPLSITVNVNPVPTITNLSDITELTGTTIPAQVFTSTIAGTSYTWTNNTPSIGLAASGTGSVPSFTAVNNTAAPITATISVTPTAPNTCPGAVQTYTITVDPTPNVNQPANVTNCEGTLTTVDFNGTTSNTNYLWTNSNTSIGLPASGSNDLSFTGQNLTNIAQTATVVVTPQAYVTQGYVWGSVNETGTLTLTAPAGKVFTSVAFASYGTPNAPVNGNYSLGACHASTSNSVISGLAIGNNTMSVVANNATFGDPCVTSGKALAVKLGYGVSVTGAPKSFTIAVNPSATIANTTDTICTGTSFNLTTVNTDIVPANTTYSWTVINNNNITGEAAQATGLSTMSQTLFNATSLNQVANYTVTPTSGAAGCVGTPFSYDITVTPLPTTISPAGPTTFCDGGSVTLIAPVAPIQMSYAYQWNLNGSPIAGATSISYIADASGSYTVTVTNNLGCSATSTAVVVTENVLPTVAAITGTTNVCIGANTTLASTTSGGTWSSSNTAIATINAATGVVAGVSAGSVVITYAVTNSNGCTNTQTATVTVNALPTATIASNGPLTFCQGGSVTLSASPVVAGNTYLWSTGATTATINVTASTTVTVTITSASGCSSTSLPTAVVVNANPTSTITASSTTTFCQGGSVTLTANAGTGFSYQWSNNTNNQVMTATTAGSYTVTVTDANGCSVTSAPTVVTVNALPTAAAITGTNSVCIGGTTLLSTTATSPTWSSSNTAVATIASNGLVTGVSAGTATISYTITNANGCTNTATVNLTVNPLPTAAIATVGATTFCQGGSVTMLASNAPAGMSYTYQWNLNGTAITGATSNTYVATISGNYTVTITSNSACSATSAATSVTVNPLPALLSNVGPSSVCENSTVTLANAQAGGLWSTANNTVATINAITGQVTGVNPGTTTLTYTFTNANGCVNSVNTNFTVNALPSAIINAAGPTTFCQGGSVVLTASTGSSYLWSTGATTASITVNNTLDVSVTVTNANGCSSTSAITSVVVNSLPVANITSLNGNSFCQGGSVTLVASAGSSYLWSNGAFTQSISVSSTQNLTVTVTNAFGCSTVSAPFAVTMNPAPTTTVTANGPTTFCAGGSVTLTAPAAASYLWNSGETTQSIIASVDGPYAVTVTDGNGCIANSVNTNITVLALPSVQAIAGNNSVCEASTVQLTSATINGSWTSSNQSVATIDATGLVTGLQAGTSTISYTVTNANGCSSTVSMAMNVNAVPVLAPITGVTSLCLGSTTTLNNAQTSGIWSSSNVAIATVAANGVVTGLSAGTATIFYTYTNASGCSSSVSAQVTVNALPSGVITANGPTTFCQGGSVELVAPVAASYSWSNGSATSSIIVNNSGSYDLTITDANGCTGSVAPMIVTVNALPNATIVSSGSNVCLGSTVTLTASGGIAYSWSNNATTAAINVVAANNYVVTVTDANGCVNTASETVVFNANPAVTLTANGPTVFCQGGSVTVTATGGNNYVWSNGTLGATASFYQSGNYYVMVTNAAGCTTQSSIVHVTVNTVPVVAAITGSNSVCEGGNMTLSSATIGGTWTVNNNFIANIDGAGNVTGLNAGTTTVTYTVSNNGCTASAVAQVNVLNNPVTPTITASGATSLCPGGSVVLFASNAPNYQWSNGPTTPFVVASQSGAYTVTVTGLNGCSATSLPVNVFIGDNTNPVITAPLNVTVTPNLGCEAVGVTLGSPVTSDNCSVASVTNDAPAIYPIGTTTVTWTVTDGSGNVATATQLVTVTDQTAPTAYAPANVTVSSNANCEATGVQLGTPIATDNCTNNLVVTNNAPTTYPLGNTTVTWTITDAAGNVTTVDQTVTVVDQTAPVVLLANTSIILDANGNGTIDFTALDNGSYDNCGIASAVLSQSDFDCSNVGKNFVTVTLTDNSGNQASAQIMVTVIASDACGGSNWSGPVVPDAFTPNGNNYNDTWVIPGLEGYNTKEMAVYSRYGTLVYYNTQYNNDWDGTLLNTGTQVPDGTYYYILNLDGGKQLNGYVYINRVKQ